MKVAWTAVNDNPVILVVVKTILAMLGMTVEYDINDTMTRNRLELSV